MALDASELLAAVMPPPATVTVAAPASRGTVSLRPPAVPIGTGVAFEAQRVDTSVMLPWDAAGIVQASGMRAPPAGTVLTPVQVAVEGIYALPPSARRARVCYRLWQPLLA